MCKETHREENRGKEDDKNISEEDNSEKEKIIPAPLHYLAFDFDLMMRLSGNKGSVCTQVLFLS